MSDNLDAHQCSFEHLCESTKDLNEVLQQEFVVGIRMAPFNMKKKIEDFRAKLEKVSMAAKWEISQMHDWECRGSAACEELLRKAYKTLERVREQKVAETQ
jgi:hypothetical protein